MPEMIRVKTFTSQLKIFHAKQELDDLDRAVNEFLASRGIGRVVSVCDAVTTGSSGETIGIIRTVTYEEPPEALREYRARAEKAIEEWSAQAEALRERAAQLGAEARRRLERHLAEARTRRDEARRRLAELARTGGDAWEDLRAGADAALEDLKAAVEKAAARIRPR